MSDAKNKKWVFIANPIAGNGDGEKIVSTLKQRIEKYVSSGYSYIIAVGGDGTMNEVGKTLLDKKD
jgi:diacylglycerol kinase family enzyme